MELCKPQIGDVDLKTGRVEVKHAVIGGAKGAKEEKEEPGADGKPEALTAESATSDRFAR